MAGASGRYPKDDAGQSPAVPATLEAATRAASKARPAGLADDPTILIVTGVSRAAGRRRSQQRSPNDSAGRWRKVTSSIRRRTFAKMHSAHPLDDRDQWSWLREVAAWIDGCRQARHGRRDHLLGAQAQLSRLPDPWPTAGARRLFARREAADRRAPGRTQRAFHARQTSSTATSRSWRSPTPTRIQSSWT